MIKEDNNIDDEDYNELYNLGKEIKNAFIEQQRNRFAGNYNIPKRVSNDKWISAAKLCKSANMNASVFVNIFFEYIDSIKYKYAIKVGDICGGKLVRDALRYFFSTNIVDNVSSSSVVENSNNLHSVGSSLYSKAINKSILETNVENYINYQIKFLFKLQKEIKNLSNDEYSLPSNVLMLRMVAFAIPAWLRVLSAPKDPIIRERFGLEALDQLLGGISGLKESIESKNILGYDRDRLEAIISELKIRFGE